MGYSIIVQANPEGDENTLNYVLGDSKLLLGMEIEVPLEFRADMQFRDTLMLNIDDNENAQYVEYANLHYRFKNEFPLNIGATLILYDSINDLNLDTIVLNNLGNKLLLTAAPVDADGITIRDQVAEVPGVMELNREQIVNFFNKATKVIIIGELSSYNPQTVSSVKILSNYALDFKFNIEAKIHYQGSIGN